MAFSFGETPPVPLGGGGGGGGGGSLFSSNQPPNPSTTTTTATPSINNNMDSATTTTTIIANIPSYQSLFPNYAIRKSVEIRLARWRNHQQQQQQEHYYYDSSSSSSSSSSFAAMELIRLLSLRAASGEGGRVRDDDDEAAAEEVAPVGEYLANPNHSILNFFPMKQEGGASTNTTTSSDDSTEEEEERRLHRALLAGAAEFASGVGANNGGTSGSSAGGGGGSAFYITLANPITTTTSKTTTTIHQIEKKTKTKGEGTIVAIITPRISHEILQLASELHLEHIAACALYAEAKAILLSSSSSSSSHRATTSSSDIDNNNDDDAFLHQLHDNNNNNSRNSRSRSDYVTMLLRMGQAGYYHHVNSFSDKNNDGTKNSFSSSTIPTTTTTTTTTLSMTTTTTTADEEDRAVRNIAHHLYFRDRSSILSILYDLIQHRVEAASDILEETTMTTTTAATGGNHSKNAILIGTDQLLEAGLVTNLMNIVRELTGKIDVIDRSLKKKEESEGGGGGDVNSSTPNGTSAASLSSSSSAGVFFGGGSSSSSLPPTAAKKTTRRINDMEFAFRGYAHLQRQLASECLFLLSYHTQWNVEEVVSLIDLVRDLTNGDDNGGGGASSLGEGLPLLDPLLDDVPSPYDMVDSSPLPLGVGGGGFPWLQQLQQQQQQQPSAIYGSNNFYGAGIHQWQSPYPTSTTSAPFPPQQVKDAKEWEDELVSLLWKRGQPQLLRCVSTLILTVVCALDANHVLVDRKSHGPNVFGVGNALFPPLHSAHEDRNGHNDDDVAATNAMRRLLPIHQRLDPDSESAAEESWTRRDIWGLLLVPYALLLRNTTAAATTGNTTTSSPLRGATDATPRPGSGGGNTIDIKGTYSQCLMVASQLKSLTFARLSLLPSVSSSLVGHDIVDGGGDQSSSASIYDFHLSTLSEFTAQYIDALGTTGNLPITRQEWLDEEMNMAQTEWMEKEQRRQFGEWAGEPVLPQNDDDEDDVAEGPRAVNLLDRPDCLEDVFALASSVCEAYPLGAKSFWYTTEMELVEGGEDGLSSSAGAVLSPSRALQTLDLFQSENDSSLYVYLSYLSSLAIADAARRGSPSGADMVHSYLAGNQTINPHSPGTDRQMHVMWREIIETIRWYADHLSPSDDATAPSEDGTINSTAKLRGSNSATTDETSTSYYYGLGGGISPVNSGGDNFSSSPEHPERGSSKSAAAPVNVTQSSSEKRELGDVERNTLMAVLCLVSNVASKCVAAREFILGIRLPSKDMNDGGGLGYQDSTLEILFALLTITSLPPEIMGMAFVAIANLLQPCDDSVGAASADMSDSNDIVASLSVGDDLTAKRNHIFNADAMRAWELVEICQFVPIKLLSQYSSYAAGAGSMSRISSSNLSLQNKMRPADGANDKVSSTFPESTDYGMIYQFEHVESKLGNFPATEGFLFLLSTLVKVVGCPTNLGSQWRLRPGCAPYIEYVTDFILPRATGTDKSARPTRFARVSDECRLVARALEVVEAVIVRYAISTSKEQHLRYVKFAEGELGLASIVSDIFCIPDYLDEEEVMSSSQDFQDSYIPPQDSAALRDCMLEASFGNPVPLPKSPGFAILSNLLSTNGGLLLQIILTLVSKNGGAKGIHTFNESIHSKLLATSLFRETPPNLQSAQESIAIKSREERNIITGKSCQAMLSSLQQSIIQSMDPVLLITYFEKSIYPPSNIAAAKAHGASSRNAVLWRERIVLLSLRILCAAAAREESFIQLVKEASSAPLNVVPTLVFMSSIHGSYAHRFVKKEKVNVSRLSQLLTDKSAHGKNHGRNSSPEILPTISEYVGYNARSLADPQCIARCSFGIVSYISHTLPHSQCVHSLCGSDDTDGVRLAAAFSTRLLSQTTDTWDSEAGTLTDAILEFILSNITWSNSTFNHSNLSFVMLGLSGELRHNCLNVILELISDREFVLDPRTSSTATKCFEIIHLVCKLGKAHGLPANVQHQQSLLMEKLRRRKFWHTQIVRYIGTQGNSTHSIFQEISNSYGTDNGHDLNMSKTNNAVLHSIAFLLQGLAIELYCLAEQQTDGLSSPNHQFQSLLSLLFSQPNPLLLSALIDMPLGQSSNEFIRDRLHRFAAPSNEVLKMCSRRLSGFVEGCAGYEIIDVESLIHHFQTIPLNSLEEAKEWALTWNKFVHRAHACSHVTGAFTDVIRVSLISTPLATDIPELQVNLFINSRTIMEILCTMLMRMLSPNNFDAVGLYSIVNSDAIAVVEPECASSLSLAALGLVEVVIESSIGDGAVAGFSIVEEDVARVFSLLISAISSCSESGLGMPAATLSCALARVLGYSAEANYSVFSQSTPGSIEVCSKAVAFLLRLSHASVLEDGVHTNAHKASGQAIALAARSGLSSLIEHMKSNEQFEIVSELCSQIFTSDEITSEVDQLVRAMNSDDNDVTHLLQQIALFYGGVHLLAKAGVTTELLKFAKEYSLSEHAYLASHFGSIGAAELKPPLLLEGHLSLLTALLASPLTASDRVALAIDSLQLLKIYSATFERVIQLFPNYFDLAMKFIEALQLTYSALNESTELNILESTLLYVDESLLTLERCVLRVTYQLSASPFPRNLLPPLPMELINVEKIQSRTLKNVSTNSGNDSSWWDNISGIASKDDEPMQIPPTGSSSVVSHQLKFAPFRSDAKTQWSERKYQYAISMSKCLDISILFLTTWINVVSKRDAPTFCIDAVAIAKGICRCSDASRVRIL